MPTCCVPWGLGRDGGQSVFDRTPPVQGRAGVRRGQRGRTCTRVYDEAPSARHACGRRRWYDLRLRYDLQLRSRLWLQGECAQLFIDNSHLQYRTHFFKPVSATVDGPPELANSNELSDEHFWSSGPDVSEWLRIRTNRYYSPLTRHRTRNGGGVTLYCHAALSIKRLSELELWEEELIWASNKIPSVTLIICCLHLQPNQTTDRLTSFLKLLTESVCLAQCYSPTPTAILLLGDFKAGNIYLDHDTQHKHSSLSPFSTAPSRQKSGTQADHSPGYQNRRKDTKYAIFDIHQWRNDQPMTNEIFTNSGTMSSFSNLVHPPVIV